MQRALALAGNGLYTTRPNPRVGCVLVRDGQLAGEGWHARAGEPHAEVHALRQATDARGATAYVTLEPCAHFGRTPPCMDALIAAQVSRVVIATSDPYPAVSGRGIAALQKAGIAVSLGVLAAPARWLNIGFFSRVQRKRPWLRAKLAHSLDGRTALGDGRSQWLTSEPARLDGHHWRAQACVLMTGIGTILADNPRLSVRLPAGPEIAAQRRVIVDPELRTPADAKIFADGVATLLVHREQTSPARSRYPSYVQCQAFPELAGELDLNAVCAHLASAWACNEIHVEAGPGLVGALQRQGLLDELLLYQAPLLLGATAKPLLAIAEPPSLAQAARWWRRDLLELGPDLRQIYISGAHSDGQFQSVEAAQ